MSCSNLSANDILPLAKHISSSITIEKPTVSYRRGGGGGPTTKETSSEGWNCYKVILFIKN
jgi:hypothetical protein